MTGRAVRTTCAYCGVGCGVSATVTGERTVTIKGDAGHRANFGRLCSKGTHLGETVGLEGRLLTPEVFGRQAGWDEALDLVATRLRDCIEQHGPDSVAFYVSGQLLTEDYYVANKLMKGFIGSGNIDTNSRLCMASAVAAHNRAFGEDIVPCTYDDLEAADLVLLVGSNTAWCHPVLWQRLERAREQHGTKLVVIDPRRTETAEQADLHVPVAPDGDVALFNSLLAEMQARGLLDADYLAEHVNVPEDFWAGLTGDHGIAPDTFRSLADLVAAHPKMVTMFSMGANQSVSGTDKGNAIINLHLATGRINRLGAGPFSITGQPNAMGGREAGGLANMLACHLGFSKAERADVAAFWQTDRLCTGPGLKAVEMFQAIHEGRIKFVWVMATNPAVSLPDAGFVREALARCETVVVSEAIADTDTTRLAHVLLPALAWGEKDGTVTNSERLVSRQRPLFDPPGESLADWQIMSAVARRLGWGDDFAWDSVAGIFREYAAMTALAGRHGKVLDLTDKAQLDDAGFDLMEPFQWGGAFPLANGYATPDRRARLVTVQAPEPAAANPDFPFRLNNGRYRDQWHTMTRTGWSATLSQHRREPLLEVHPADAAARGLTAGGLARIVTAQGSAVYRVALSDGQRRGDLFVPMHWTDVTAGGGRTNRLPGQGVDPVSGQPGYKNTPAQVEPLKPEWRAFLVSREIAAFEGLIWWARSRVAGGWLCELAGDGACDIARMLPDGARIEAADHVRGMRRVAVQDETGALLAALFVTRSGELPPREWVAAQLAQSAASPIELLAGRASTPAPDRGPIVCICHGVGENEIAACGAGTVAEVGEATQAGTNCGSCRPAIARLLAGLELVEAAE
ncbi:MAG: molybdopterin-dependent oxidoreductase [Alphaproteobacteria bacterium]|nr:molybdopterin-dependent oxidoreductase [Alphaproteobacteria bacterium]